MKGWIVVLGVALLASLAACSNASEEPSGSGPTPTAPGIPDVPRNGTYSLSAFRAEEVARAWGFFDALNRGRGRRATALFGGRQLLVVDCDYATEKPVRYEGLGAARGWVRRAIAHHIHLVVTRFWNENADRQGSHGLAADVRLRTDDALAALGHPAGTKPPFGAQVAFTSAAKIRYLALGYPRGCHV